LNESHSELVKFSYENSCENLNAIRAKYLDFISISPMKCDRGSMFVRYVYRAWLL